MAPKLFILFGLINIIQRASTASDSQTSPSSASLNRGLFAADLFRQISKTKLNENVIISPMSIQTALAMVYLGAEGETASQLIQSLRLSSTKKEEVGQSFAEILNAKSGEAQLNIANRIFVSLVYQLQSSFNERAQKYFNSEAEAVNFNQSAEAVKTINAWVEQKTNNKITNLLQPESVDHQTKVIIVNAIYFKGKWQVPFNAASTSKRPFWLSQTTSVEADAMYLNDVMLKFAELSELDATAIELPYKDSDISMMIILPNERDGLANLEEKLSSVAINEMSSEFKSRDLNVVLPKFKIEFNVGLVDVLKELGIRSIFDHTANLSGMLESSASVSVTDVQHKAFIDVNEAGSEAAAATFVQVSAQSLKSPPPKNFKADHPFVFAIKSSKAVYFIGHVAVL